MPSVANVIGTDLSTYKLVSKMQFACNLMHVGRDEKIPMAMYTEDNPIIVSPAYFVFEVTNNDQLLPEYLMMWFRRPEFDRNAWFYTDADVRGGMGKESLLDMQLPIPSITHQREIVAEYETLTRRIRLNEQMIQHLESTAQALYRKMFVDGVQLITKVKNNMKNSLMSVADKICLRKRAIIETLNDELKNIAQIEHSRHKSFNNFIANALGAIAAYCFFEKKPDIELEFINNGQLTLF